jgi:GrpB-like predicted nucleotidyltransferase (UPF0157 family)
VPDLASTPDGHILVADHDPTWAATFERIRADLVRALEAAGASYLSIEHVGSTSVPGLAAKPIIDVDIVVRADDVESATAAIVRAGYEPLGTLGVEDRWAFREPDRPRRNVYVTIDGCLALRNHLAVRDTLRRDPELAAEYGAVKQELARRYTVDEIDAYIAGKTDVLQRVLAAGGLGPEDLATIAGVNRTEDT